MDELANKFDGKTTKITLEKLKISNSRLDECLLVNKINIIQSIMLKQLPAERISGVVNLCYVLYGNGTEQDVENALVK